MRNKIRSEFYLRQLMETKAIYGISVKLLLSIIIIDEFMFMNRLYGAMVARQIPVVEIPEGYRK